MKRIKNLAITAALFAVASLLFVLATPKTLHALVATLVQITNTPVNPVPISESTHLGQPHNNLVTLQVGGISTENGSAIGFYGDYRVGEDGSRIGMGNLPTFAVPAGQVFIVTDYAVTAACLKSTSCNVILTFTENGFPAGAQFDNVGPNQAGSVVSRQLTTVMGPGLHPIIVTDDGGVAFGYIHGYLTPQ